MLLWEEGVIKVEVSRKKKRHCHAAPITQFEFENGDLTTVGMDELYSATYQHNFFSWFNQSCLGYHSL
jgi:hypothetical protein